MKINVSNLKSHKNDLKDEMKKHKDIYSTFKTYLDNADLYWDDPNSDDFFILTKLEQLRFEQATAEIKQLVQIYDNLTSSYGKYGNIISAELKSKNIILADIKAVITELGKCINLFNSIDGTLPEGATAKAKINDLNSLKLIANNLLKEVTRILDDFIKTEKQVLAAASALKPEIIKIDDVEIFRKSGVNYKGESQLTYTMDKNEINKTIDLIFESNQKEKNIYAQMQNTLSSINGSYKSENTSILKGKCNNIKDKIYILYNYHINDEYVFRDCYDFYINTAENTKKDISKLIESGDMNGRI